MINQYKVGDLAPLSVIQPYAVRQIIRHDELSRAIADVAWAYNWTSTQRSAWQANITQCLEIRHGGLHQLWFTFQGGPNALYILVHTTEDDPLILGG